MPERREEGLVITEWRNLAHEVAASPWPIVVCINPEPAAESESFSTLVESCTGGMRKKMIKTLHCTGSPTPLARKHFGITVAPPAVAVFHEGRLIGQFEGVGTKGSLRKKIRALLP